jgi:hypothetical protein
MRKYRYLAVAAAGVLVLAAPVGTALAASAHSASNKPVLTVGSTHGSAVKKGAKIGASLARGTSATFKISKYVASCPKSSFTAKVVKNPAAKNKATLSVTADSIGGKCTLNPVPLAGVSIASITALHLPLNATVTAKGVETISPQSKSKPLGFSVVVDYGGSPIATCVFTASSVSGKASNKHNTVTFTKQPFTLSTTLTNSKDLSDCQLAGTSASFSATYGPVTDSSVKHHPKVFVG